VRDHCLNVGVVAEALIEGMPPPLRALLPPDAVTLAALHDVGKITLGFQAKCPAWLRCGGLPAVSMGEIELSVTDHALVSQVFFKGSSLLRSSGFGPWRSARIMAGQKGKMRAATCWKLCPNGQKSVG